MKNNCIYRYHSYTTAVVVRIDCTKASLAWTVIQVAFALLTNNTTLFIVSEAMKAMLTDSLASTEGDRDGSVTFANATEDTSSVIHHPIALSFSYSPLHQDDQTGQVIIPSIIPSLSQLLKKEIQTVSYLRDKYGVEELMDEFDLLPDEQRNRYVTDRSTYLLSQVRQSSQYYASTLSNNVLSSAPIITGQTLLEVLLPLLLAVCL
jgi:hypothetical protein